MSGAKPLIEPNSIIGDDETDTRLLRAMAGEAESYILSFEWCLELREGFFADGFGGIVGIFLFRADIAKLGNDRWVWVFVGDVPYAYLEMDQSYRSPQDALGRYIKGISEWIEAVRAGGRLDGLIPIEAKTDSDALEALASKADTLRQHILPHISASEFHFGSTSQQ